MYSTGSISLRKIRTTQFLTTIYELVQKRAAEKVSLSQAKIKFRTGAAYRAHCLRSERSSFKGIPVPMDGKKVTNFRDLMVMTFEWKNNWNDRLNFSPPFPQICGMEKRK